MKKYIVFPGLALSVLLLGSVSSQAISLNIGGDGGLVGLSTSSDTSSSGGIDVEVNLGGGSGLDVDAEVNADFGGDGNLVTLFGKPLVSTGGDNLVTVDTTDDAEALVTLFGTAGSTGIEVDLAEGNDDEATARLFGGAGGGVEAGADLLYDSGGLPGTGLIGEIDPVITLFGGDDGDGGPGTDGTQTGSIGGGGGSGGDGITGGKTPGVVPGTRTRVAATAGAPVRTSCFTPDDGQIAHLLGRVTYDGSVTAAWRNATDVSVVPVNLCPDARGRLEAALDADANIGILQAAVASDARISASLRPAYEPDDVLSVDKAGNRLVVYVY